MAWEYRACATVQRISGGPDGKENMSQVEISTGVKSGQKWAKIGKNGHFWRSIERALGHSTKMAKNESKWGQSFRM